MTDQRREARTRMIRAAQIAFGSAALDCALFDLSAAGARVSLLAPSEVPDVVILRLPGGRTRAARRRWQQGAQVGFEFLAAAARRSHAFPGAFGAATE